VFFLLNPHSISVADFVIAGFAAGFAVVEAILAKTNANLGLAKAAIAFTFTAVLHHLTLHAAVFGLAGNTHNATLIWGVGVEKSPW